MHSFFNVNSWKEARRALPSGFSHSIGVLLISIVYLSPIIPHAHASLLCLTKHTVVSGLQRLRTKWPSLNLPCGHSFSPERFTRLERCFVEHTADAICIVPAPVAYTLAQ